MSRIAQIALFALNTLLAVSPPPAWSAFLTSEPVIANGADQTDPAKTLHANGVAALQAGDVAAAEKAFGEARKANPRMPQPLIGLADVALLRGDRAEAKKWLDKAVQIAPADDAALQALSAFYFTGKEYAQAEATLKITLDKNSKNPRAWLDLGDLYATALNRPSDAAAAYREVIKLAPDHAGAHHGLARALAATGQYSEAEVAFRRAAVLAPNLPVPLHSLARMQLSRGETKAALASLDAVLKIEPKFLPALLDKGDLALSQGKSDTALALYHQAVDTNPKSAAAHFKYGAVLQTRNQLEDAKKAYEMAIELDPQFAEAYNNLAWMQAQLRNNLGQAAQYAATAVKLAPDNAAYRDTLGWVHRAQKQLPEAETVLEKAATMQPPLADVQYHLGVVYAEQSKNDLARKAFENALEIDPKHAEAKAALTRLASGS